MIKDMDNLLKKMRLIGFECTDYNWCVVIKDNQGKYRFIDKHSQNDSGFIFDTFTINDWFFLGKSKTSKPALYLRGTRGKLYSRCKALDVKFGCGDFRVASVCSIGSKACYIINNLGHKVYIGNGKKALTIEKCNGYYIVGGLRLYNSLLENIGIVATL